MNTRHTGWNVERPWCALEVTGAGGFNRDGARVAGVLDGVCNGPREPLRRPAFLGGRSSSTGVTEDQYLRWAAPSQAEQDARGVRPLNHWCHLSCLSIRQFQGLDARKCCQSQRAVFD